MPWNREKPIEEELGLTKDELKAKLALADTLKVDNDKLKSDLTTINTDLTSVKETLKNLEIKNAPIVKVETPETIAFEDNPEAAMAQRLAPTQNLALQTRAEVIYDRVSRSFKDWPTYKERVDELLKNTSLNGRVQEATVRNAYAIAVGEKVLKDKAAAESHLESGSGSGNNGDGTGDTKKPTFTEDEKEYMKKVGMTEEQWLNAKKGVRYV